MGPTIFRVLVSVMLLDTFGLSTLGLDVRSAPNLESIFEGDENLYQQYQLLNSVVKRQTKGSCSCTCETKPIVRYVGDDRDDKNHQERNGGTGNRTSDGEHKATILRTGVSGLNPSLQNHHVISHGVGPSRMISDIESEYPPKSGSDLPEVGSRNVDVHASDRSPNTDIGDWSQTDQQQVDNRVAETGWGHGSRFPWLHLPNVMCFRSSCSSDADCCRKFNLCDRSANVCVDCWYGSTCTSEAECCEKYPYCELVTSTITGQSTGRCVDAL